MPESRKEHRVVIVGAGFAGFNAARELHRVARATTEITVINLADYFLYLLMPQVTGGLVEPRHICVSLPRRLRSVRFVLGMVTRVDPPGEDRAVGQPRRRVRPVRLRPADPDRRQREQVLNTLTPPEATSFSVISAESVPLDVNQPRA